jgi:hypothetical protein
VIFPGLASFVTFVALANYSRQMAASTKKLGLYI